MPSPFELYERYMESEEAWAEENQYLEELSDAAREQRQQKKAMEIVEIHWNGRMFYYLNGAKREIKG